MREFKKSFFMSLEVVLLVISNLLCFKLTSLLDLTVAVSVFVYPFTFLCTLMLINLGGKKEAYRGVVIASLIQIFITISYTIAVKLGIQTEVPDMAQEINAIFKVNELNLIASLIAFVTSNCFLIYIYDTFKRYRQELYGIALGLLAALFSNAIIYQLINLHDQEINYVINMLLSNIIISIVMLIIITIIFYILKENDQETIEIKNMNIDINKYKSDDLAIEDVIFDKNNEDSKEKKSTSKKNTNRHNNTYQNSKKTSNRNSSKTTKSKKTTSKNTKTNRKNSNKKDN